MSCRRSVMPAERSPHGSCWSSYTSPSSVGKHSAGTAAARRVAWNLELGTRRTRPHQPPTVHCADVVDGSCRAAAGHSQPMSAFVRECCVKGPDQSVVVDILYERYRDWCNDDGLRPLPKQLFGRDLRAVLPRLRIEKPH